MPRPKTRCHMNKGARMRVLLLAFSYLNFYWKFNRFVEGYIERGIPKGISEIYQSVQLQCTELFYYDVFFNAIFPWKQ